MKQSRLFKGVTKQELELIAFLSGVIASLASSTGYFYGRFSTEYGPIATFAIAIVWFGFFWKITSINIAEEPDNEEIHNNEPESQSVDGKNQLVEPSEEAHRKKRKEKSSGLINFLRIRTKDESNDPEARAISYYIYPWIWTFTIWALGILAHLALPTQVVVNGYVTYGGEANLHNTNAKIEVYYANRKIIDLYTDKYGYFQATSEKILNQDIIYLRVESENFNPESIEITLNEFTRKLDNQNIQIYPELKRLAP